MTYRCLILALPLVLGTAAAEAQEPASASAVPPALAVPALDPAVRTMIDTAIQSGDAQAAATVIRFARAASPGADAEIDAIEAAWKAELAANDARAAEERTARLRSAGLLDGWKGQLELGASRATGNSRSLGLIGSIDLTREGLDWRQKLYARAEFQDTNGVATTERVLASWQPNYKFAPRGYAFGLAQYERDPFAGYEARYTAGTGLGYGVIAGPRVKLDLEGGPALRYTEAVDGTDSSRLVGRGSLTFNWRISPSLQLVQSGTVYLEEGDTNATASTALDTKLIGALKARFSYNVQYENDAPAGARALNTQSRATFVYSF